MEGFVVVYKQTLDDSDLHRFLWVLFMVGRLTSSGRPVGGSGSSHLSLQNADRCQTGMEQQRTAMMTEMKDSYTTILTLMYSKCKSCVMDYRNVLVETL